MQESKYMKIIYAFKGEEIFVDDEEYGELNKIKWCCGDGYALSTLHINDKKFTLRMHRVILKALKGQCIDHINHNKLDNRKENLRFCSKSENSRNKILRANNISGVSGVRWDKQDNKWEVYVAVKNKKIHLGHYENLDNAIAVRKSAEQKYYGEFTYKASDAKLQDIWLRYVEAWFKSHNKGLSECPLNFEKWKKLMGFEEV